MCSRLMAVLVLAALAITGRTCSAQFTPEQMQRMQIQATQSATRPRLDTYRASAAQSQITVTALQNELNTALTQINAAPAGPLKTAALTARSNAAVAVSQFRTEAIKERQIYDVYESMYQATDRALVRNQLGLAATNQSTYPGYETRWFNQSNIATVALTSAATKMQIMRTALAALR